MCSAMTPLREILCRLFSGLDGSLAHNIISINSTGDSFSGHRGTFPGHRRDGQRSHCDPRRDPDRIVMHAYITVNGKEVKVKEISNVRFK